LVWFCLCQIHSWCYFMGRWWRSSSLAARPHEGGGEFSGGVSCRRCDAALREVGGI
jgi:hypothetical protein